MDGKPLLKVGTELSGRFFVGGPIKFSDDSMLLYVDSFVVTRIKEKDGDTTYNLRARSFSIAFGAGTIVDIWNWHTSKDGPSTINEFLRYFEDRWRCKFIPTGKAVEQLNRIKRSRILTFSQRELDAFLKLGKKHPFDEYAEQKGLTAPTEEQKRMERMAWNKSKGAEKPLVREQSGELKQRRSS